MPMTYKDLPSFCFSAGGLSTLTYWQMREKLGLSIDVFDEESYRSAQEDPYQYYATDYIIFKQGSSGARFFVDSVLPSDIVEINTDVVVELFELETGL